MYWTDDHDKLMCREIFAVDPFEVAVAVLLDMLSLYADVPSPSPSPALVLKVSNRYLLKIP